MKNKAYIIGKLGQLRNPALPSEVSDWFEIIQSSGFVEARSIDVQDLVNQELFEAMLAKRPTPNEVACFVAHLRAWEWLVRSSEEYLLVLEDDVKTLNTSVLEQLHREISSLSGPWQVALERRDADFIWTHRIPRKRLVFRSFVQPRGTGAYVISRLAADRLLSDFKNKGYLDGIADASLMQSDLVKFHICLPPVFEVIKDLPTLIGAPNRISKQTLGVRDRFGYLVKNRRINGRKFSSYFALLILKPLKYLNSYHFATAWLSRFRG